jgi:HPt (histidine-containing phosphotransfer) domain-containing protein
MEVESIKEISGYLEKEFELDSEDIAEMLNEYCSNMDALIEKAYGAIASEDLEKLKITAHSIKGASANLGANYIASLGLALERTALSGNPVKIKEAASAVDEAFNNLKKQKTDEA